MKKIKKNKEQLLIFAEEITFMVKALQKKLEEAGYKCLVSPSQISQLQEVAPEEKVLIYYMDELSTVDSKLMVFIRDLCMDQDKLLILIGSDLERNNVGKFVPDEYVSHWYTRPMDMDAIIEDLDMVFDEDTKRARMKHILIVDDDTDYSRTIREILKNKYRVSMANSGVQAIATLVKKQTDLILLDYDMPVANGLQVMEMLKADDKLKEVPVMFVTGIDDREDIMRVLELGPVDYILKPIKSADLLEKLDSFFIDKALRETGKA